VSDQPIVGHAFPIDFELANVLAHAYNGAVTMGLMEIMSIDDQQRLAELSWKIMDWLQTNPHPQDALAIEAFLTGMEKMVDALTAPPTKDV
jgi:hypothetical protein